MQGTDELLANDKPLPDRYRDHLLTGNWKGHRDLHLKPDLVLIYKKPDPDPPIPGEQLCLQLIRLGSHSELGL